MAIVSIPAHAPAYTMHCAICKQPVALSDATAGIYDTDGQQLFACNRHVWNRSEHLVGWADCVIAQQLDTPNGTDAASGHTKRGEYGQRRIY